MSDKNDPAKNKTFFCVRVAVLVTILGAIAFFYFNNTSGFSGEAEQALRQHIDSESKGRIKLSSFRKTDGQKTEMLGVQGYNLAFEGEITFASDGFWLTHNPFAGGGLTFTVSDTGGAFGGMNGATQVHFLNKAKIGGTMVGQKSEKGWSFDIGECHVISGPN